MYRALEHYMIIIRKLCVLFLEGLALGGGGCPQAGGMVVRLTNSSNDLSID